MYHYVKGGGLAKSEWSCRDCGDIIHKGKRFHDNYMI